MKRHVLISKQGKKETYVIVDDVAKTCTCNNFIYRKTCKHVDALNTTNLSSCPGWSYSRGGSL